MWIIFMFVVYLGCAVFMVKQALQIDRLRRDCSEIYQVIGAMSDESYPFDHPDVQRALDNMSAAANGRPRPHDDLLPWPKDGV